MTVPRTSRVKTQASCSILTIVLLLGGCSSSSVPSPNEVGATSGGQDNGSSVDQEPETDNQPESGSPGDQRCGDRTISTLPPAGLLNGTTNLSTTSSNPLSGLSRAVGGLTVVGGGCIDDNAEPTVTEYELGWNGEVFDSGQRFVVASGCLFLGVPPQGNTGEIPFNPGRCADGQVEISQSGTGTGGFFGGIFGPLPTDPESPYICASARRTACLDCSEDESGWTVTVTQTAVYTALGSISDVPIFNPCDAASEEFANIIEGENITISFIIQTRYESE